MTKKILIATGGTGGHIFPAYSLANYLIRKKYNVKLTSDYRGLKYLKNVKNLNIVKIPSSPLAKGNILKLLFSFLVIIYSIARSFFLLLFERPSMVFGMGGYSSFPVCIAASILRIKFVIYENNLIIGKANKYLLFFAKKIFVSYKELEGISKKYKNKIFEIGNLVREEIINERDIKKNFDHLKILVLGGSQAAKIFADLLPEIFYKCSNHGIALKISQQCLPQQNENLTSFYKKNTIDFEIFNFTNKIENYFSKINLAITRSGSSILAELTNARVPFISVPLPSSADNHQFHNAMYYCKNYNTFLVEEKDLENKLLNIFKEITNDHQILKNISDRQGQYSDINVYENINQELQKIL